MKKVRFREIFVRELHQSYLVVGLCAGILAGVVVGLGCRVNYFASPVWIGLVVILFVFAYLKPKYVFVVVMVVAGMVLAFYRVAGELVGEDYVRQFYGQTVVVMGVIAADPVTDEEGTNFKLKELKFGEGGEYAAGGSIYVGGRKNEDLAWGDTVMLSGKLSEGFGAYVGYMYRPEVVRHLKPEPGNWVLVMRNWFSERVREVVDEPEVRLGLSYLLGMRAGLTDEFTGQLRVVGLTHIVVASGAHLSILVEVARKIFGRLSRAAGLMGATVFIVVFMAMVGWTPSIMRAGVMAILTLVGWYVGRKIAPWRMILMVAVFTLMVEPNFVGDLGWQLSFASYAGIMMLAPGLTRFFYGRRKPSWVGSTVLTTVAATVMTLPVVLYNYGQVSLISVVANLVILPTLPIAMGLVFLSGVVMGVPGVGVAVGWCATRMLEFHIAVVGWLGEMLQFWWR